jgi:hypothetical protein
MMPAFWTLGFHLCRWGYNTIENLTAVTQVIHTTKMIKKRFSFILSVTCREIMMLSFRSMFNGQILM